MSRLDSPPILNPHRKNTHKLTAWNIAKGGHGAHSLNSPPRHESVAHAVAQLGTDTLVVSDAFGWGQPGVLEQVLPGYDHRYFVPTNDPNDAIGPRGNIGVAIATTTEHDEPRVLDLGDRRGLLVPLRLGKSVVNLLGVYLFWANEESRKKSIEAILDQVNLSQPTIIAGDFNAQVPPEYAGRAERLRSMVLKLGALALGPTGHRHAQIVKEFEKRTALGLLHDAGFTNQASAGTPTAEYPNPLTSQFRIDHIYAKMPGNSSVRVGLSEVGPLNRISDHRPVHAGIHY